jgi:hypothetical protein
VFECSACAAARLVLKEGYRESAAPALSRGTQRLTNLKLPSCQASDASLLLTPLRSVPS